MPQPKSSSSRTGRRSQAGAGKTSSAKRAPRRTSASGRPSASQGRTKAAPRGRTSSASRAAGTRATRARDDDFSGKNVAAFRDALWGSVLNPLNLLILSRDRIQEAMDEAVERGRMTREDATELVQALIRQGRKQTSDVLSDLEQLLGRSREGFTGTVTRARKSDAVDRVVREADRARRVAGVGPAFPILGYDELTAAQVSARLGDLTPAELRKVRDYERRHGNRKSVLETIEQKLG